MLPIQLNIHTQRTSTHRSTVEAVHQLRSAVKEDVERVTDSAISIESTVLRHHQHWAIF